MAAKRWLHAVSIGLAVVVIAFYARDVARQWDGVRALGATITVDWATLALSGIVVFASYAVLIETWRRTVVAWGERLSWREAARIWFVSNLGKYVPGKVWQIGAMGLLAQQAGVSPVAAVGSSLVVNLVNIVAACLVVAVASTQVVALAGQWFAPLVVASAVAALATPWILPWMLRVARKLTGKALPDPKVPPSAILVALAGCTLGWVLYGVAFRLLAISLFGRAAGNSSSYVAVFTFSYLIGYLWLPAPGGLGARESVLQRALGVLGLEAGAAAVLLVLASRLWLTVLEALPGLLLIALGRARPTPTNRRNGPNP
ncbi:MAG: flippase-like domain-containing protein [Gemmatimonadetes bacterium]|nr:flippase-like domain-containing protein [Gemmatimonadota bacterium]MBI3566857.1 flippase-like domain-containing protein [Gemmatimonadota bacterium]